MRRLALLCSIVAVLALLLALRFPVDRVEPFRSADAVQWLLVSGAGSEKATMRLYQGDPDDRYVEVAVAQDAWTPAHAGGVNHDDIKVRVRDPDYVRVVLVQGDRNALFLTDGSAGERTVSLEPSDAAKSVCAFGGRKIKQIVFHECDGRACTAQDAAKRRTFTWSDLYNTKSFVVSAGVADDGSALQDGFSVLNREAGAKRNTVQFVWYGAELERNSRLLKT